MLNLDLLIVFNNYRFIVATSVLLLLLLLLCIKVLKHRISCIAILSLLSVLLIFNSIRLYYSIKEYKARLLADNELSKYISIEGDNIAVNNISINYNELEKVNKDFVGWIMLPESNISYPIIDASRTNPSTPSLITDYTCVCMKELGDSILLYADGNCDNRALSYLTNYYKYPSMLTSHPEFFIALKSNSYKFNTYSIASVDVKNISNRELGSITLSDCDFDSNTITLVTKFGWLFNDLIFVTLEYKT